MPDNNHLWDPQDYQANIVSVMLGTYDFNRGIPERESWTEAYTDFGMSYSLRLPAILPQIAVSTLS